MPRLARKHQIGPIFHVINRGARRRPIFGDDQDRSAFIHILSDALREFGEDCLALCLMGNHYHLVLAMKTDRLSLVMHRLGSRYTQRFNTRYGHDGPLFRGRFYSRPIDDDSYLMNCLRYVARNPLGIDPGIDLSRYRWSTHRHYLGMAPEPDWLNTRIGLAVFGGSRKDYASFVNLEDELSPTLDQLSSWLVAQRIPTADARGLVTILGPKAQIQDEAIRCWLGMGSTASVRSLRSRVRPRTEKDADLHELVQRAVQHWSLSPSVARGAARFLGDV